MDSDKLMDKPFRQQCQMTLNLATERLQKGLTLVGEFVKIIKINKLIDLPVAGHF